MNDKYKETKLGWIPKEWEVVKLGNVARCSVGIASSATHAYRETGIPLIRNQNIKEGKLDLSDILFISEEYELLHKTKRLKEGDILTVRTGYPGISAIVPKELENAQSFTTLIIRKTTNTFTSEFLCYFINSNLGKSFFKNNQAGGGQQNVGSKTLENLLFPLPPLPEQKKIAKILSTVDAKINSLSDQITETEQLKKGLMQQLLTEGIDHSEFKESKLGKIPRSWDVVKLGEIGEFKNGINKGSEDFGHGFPFINLNDVFGYSIVQTTNLGLVNSNAKEQEDYALNIGDVLFVRSSVKPTGVGLTAVVTQELDKTVYSGFLIRFRDNNLLDKDFKIHCFYNPIFRKQLLNKSTVSANTNINQKALSTLMLALPPLSEQKEIARILSKVDEKIGVLRSSQSEYEELKKGLMQVLLSGEVRTVNC